MLVIRRRGWEIPESQATPEHVFLTRRAFISGAASMAAAGALPSQALAQRVGDVPDPTGDLYPAKRNEKYVLDRDITPEKVATTYNNFYEFGFDKNIVAPAQKLPIRPWTVRAYLRSPFRPMAGQMLVIGRRGPEGPRRTGE